jgi:hypothetical protein
MSIRLSQSPIAVKFLHEIPECDLPQPEVRSYCDALGKLRDGEFPRGMILRPESIGVCVWSPVALGFRPPVNDIDGSVPCRFDKPVQALFVFSLDTAQADHPLVEFLQDPVVITLVSSPEEMKKIASYLRPEDFGLEHADDLLFTMNSDFA